MSRPRSRRRPVSPGGASCAFPVLDAEKRATLCKTPGAVVRVVHGVALLYCWKHADEIDAKQAAQHTPPKPTDHDAADAAARAKWDAKQAKLAPEKRRTWEQGLADEEADMGRKLRASRRKGGP